MRMEESKDENRKKKGDLSRKLVELCDKDPNDKLLPKITNVKLALNLKADKEIFWEQRARAN